MREAMDTPQQARHLITRLLARREHSYTELISKLRARNICAEVAEVELQKFVDNGLQSDQRFTYSIIKELVERGKGPIYIKQKLLQHQIHDLDFTAIQNELGIDWFANAQRVRIKRFGESIPTELNEIAKQQRFLYSRGFTQEHISAIF